MSLLKSSLIGLFLVFAYAGLAQDEGGDISGILQHLKDMDVNGDGKIGKDEWKGKSQRFDSLDRVAF